MKKLSFDEFTIEVYSKITYKILKSMFESKEMSQHFTSLTFHDGKELESMLKKKSYDIATEFVQIIKSKVFPESEITQDEQKQILKEVIDEHIQA